MKKASTGQYLAAWFLVAALVYALHEVLGYVVGTEFPQLLRRPNSYIYQLVGLNALVGIFSYYIAVFVYGNFPNLNYRKVVPFIWVFGLLGNLSFIGRAATEMGLTKENKGIFVFASVGIILVLLFMVTSTLKDWQNEKEEKEKQLARHAANAEAKRIEKEKLANEEAAKKAKQEQAAEAEQLDASRKEAEKDQISTGQAIIHSATSRVMETEIPKKGLSIYDENISLTEQESPNSEQHTVSEENQDSGLLVRYQTAALLLEHLPEADEAWSAVKHLIEEQKIEFLEGLEKPNAEPKNLALGAYENFLSGRPNDASEEANKAFSHVQQISTEAESEFRTIYELQGQRVPLNDLITSIERKFGTPNDQRRLAFEYLDTLVIKKKVAREAAERERLAREAVERQEQEERERLALEAAEKEARERREQEEQERLAQEAAEKEARERQAKKERERLAIFEKRARDERLAREAAERKERGRQTNRERERLALEAAEKEGAERRARRERLDALREKVRSENEREERAFHERLKNDII